MDNFRDGVLNLGQKSLDIMNEYFEGNRHGTDKVKEASVVLREAVKVSNRDQVDAQVKRSQAIRLIPYMSKDQQREYIKFTNPETAPFLLDSPGKKNK